MNISLKCSKKSFTMKTLQSPTCYQVFAPPAIKKSISEHLPPAGKPTITGLSSFCNICPGHVSHAMILCEKYQLQNHQIFKNHKIKPDSAIHQNQWVQQDPTKNILRVQNSPDITTMNSLFCLCYFFSLKKSFQLSQQLYTFLDY